MIPSFSTDDSALVCTIALLQTPSELRDTPRQRQTGGSDPRPPHRAGVERKWRFWGKSRNSSTEGCPKSDVLGVGTWKMVTHGINTNDLWKLNFYFEIFIFSKIFRSKQKLCFRKITKSPKIRTIKNQKIRKFSNIFEFVGFLTPWPIMIYWELGLENWSRTGSILMIYKN